MKKSIMSVVVLMCTCLLLGACNNNVPAESETEHQIKEIYNLYRDSGGTMSYDDWLKTIRGEDGVDGKDGHSPVVEIGANGNWYIDGVDTNIKASAKDGKDGKDGKSAYEIYCEAHPEYTGNQNQWLEDLIAGRLGMKESHTVTFYPNGGSKVPSQTIKHGEKIVKPQDPIRTGYEFNGWTCLGEPWSFIGYVVTEDMTLVANWTKI